MCIYIYTTYTYSIINKSPAYKIVLQVVSSGGWGFVGFVLDCT